MASARPLKRSRPARSRPENQRFTEAASLYGIPHWGKGFFHVSEDGKLVVRPTREASRAVALKQIVDEVALRGISTPMVIRFPQILSTSVANLNDAFARAIDEYGYGNVFRGVFPIKVNQKRVVVDHIVEAGRRYGYGLEAGSKPELLAAISADLSPESLITCNGYKDETFIRMALNAVRMKKKVVLILEKVSELDRILEVARARGVRPLLGMRSKLYARGSGKWAKSGGEAAKFGLTTPEMLEAIKILKSKKMLDCLVMLHFHIGSQITDIRKIKEAIREAGRVYAKLRAQGVPIQYLNLGGGLGVDYDGSKTAFDSSMNYSVQEYANDVVYTIQQICEEEKVPAPDARDRVRPRRHGLPLRLRDERARRGRPDRAGPARLRDLRAIRACSRSSRRSTRPSTPRPSARATTTPSSTRRSSSRSSTSGTCRSRTGPRARSSSGRSAKRSTAT